MRVRFDGSGTIRLGSARYWLRGLSVLGLLSVLASGCGGGGGGSGGGSGSGAVTAAATPPPPISVFSLSGSVQAAGATAVDGDINDPNAPYTPNDTLASAESIPNPVSVGGYVNQAGEGPPGRSHSMGDLADFYLADLQADQTVTLAIADGAADLALFLYDGPSDPSPDQASGSGTLRSITASTPGTYLIEVRVLDGASTYLLSVGQDVTPVATAGVPAGNLSGAFIPGEVILRVKDRPGALVAQRPVPGADFMGLAVKAGGPGRAVLAHLPDDEETVRRAYEVLGIPPENVLQAQALAVMSSAQRRRWQTLRIIDALRRRPEVLYAEPNYTVQPLLAPNDNFYPRQWHFPLINLPQAWDTTTGDTGVFVAVVDSGIVSTHPDLQGQLMPGYDFVSNWEIAHDGDGIDSDPNDSDGHLAVNPFHGTHVAGIVSAATNNSDGVAGAAWTASIMPLRALGPEGGTMYDVLQAVQFAAGLPNDSGTVPAQRADIINLSVTTSTYSPAAQAVFTAVRNQGVFVVAAAGNTSTPATVYPAAYNHVVSVSAVDVTKQLAPYSTFGPTVDVAAPGGVRGQDLNGDGHDDGVYSTSAYDDNGTVLPDYGYLEGTSMAAPHVAGVIALMKSLDSGLTPDTFDTLLASGRITQDLGTPGRDDSFGHGLIDAFKAVTEAAGSQPLPPLLAVSPGSLNFGSAENQATLQVVNAGGGDLTVSGFGDDVSGSPDWLAVSPEAVDSDTQLGTYRVTVRRAGLGDGSYSGRVWFDWSGGRVEVQVIAQVDAVPEDNNAGFHYVRLLDAATGVPLTEVAVAASLGTYTYQFSDVPAGSYFVVAGSDFDNDGSICGIGEACGAYLTAAQPQQITLSDDRADLTFVTAFGTPLGTASTFGGLSRQGMAPHSQHIR